MFAFKVRTIAYCFCLLAGLVSLPTESRAQSLDARIPSPVRRNEIVGRISARDLGDARLTDHFYTFAGTPGDLLITIETRNLNGDVDVFTAGALRPVLKVSVYAESTSPVTKNIYLRQREELILRIEARSPNDDDGIYRIRFSGTFEAMAGAADESDESVSLPTARKGKRVSSVGARIEDPVPPPVDVPSSSAPERTATATEDPAPMEVTKEPVKEPVVELPPRVSRNPRTRSSATSRRTSTKPAPTAESETKVTPAETESSETVSSPGATNPDTTSRTSESTKTVPGRRNSKKSSPVTTETASVPVTTKRNSTPTRGNSKRSTPATASDVSTEGTEGAGAPDAAAEVEALRNSKITIDLLDGTRFERFMTTVRRVTVENGQIVVIGKDGKIERIRLSTVVRMSIGP